MKMTATMVAMVAAMIGCGGSGGPSDDTGDDTGDDAVEIVITTEDSVLLAGQDGDGAWQALTVDENGEARMQVTSDRFGVTSLCAVTFQSLSLQRSLTHFLTPDEATDGVRLPCGTVSVDAVLVSGTTSPGASVWIASRQADVEETGAYSLFVSPGTYDVFAVLPGDPGQVLVTREVVIDDDLTLDLPVATEGVDLLRVTPNVITATDAYEVYADLNTVRDEYVSFGYGGISVGVPPQSILLPSDRPAIGAFAGQCTRQVPLPGGTPELQIPSQTTATIDGVRVEWTADPTIDWEGVTLHLSAVGPMSAGVSATAAYLDAAGGASSFRLVDPETLPGWDAGMPRFVGGDELRWSLSVWRGVYDADYTTCGASGQLIW
jgi:hypothetical protein